MKGDSIVKHAMLLFLSLTMGVAAAQTLKINAFRPAFPYEIFDSVPEEIMGEADRLSMTDFLEYKKEVRTGFVIRSRRICPQFFAGDLTITEVAAYLDEGVETTNLAIAAAYERMMRNLSGEGAAAVLVAVQRGDTKPSADTRMVDLEAVAPGMVERVFRYLCAPA
jgi:hypothetical protein